jgi:hypothetical protein
VVKIDSIYTFNPTKIPRILHQNDQELMLYHSVYDSIRLGRKNQKDTKMRSYTTPYSLKKWLQYETLKMTGKVSTEFSKPKKVRPVGTNSKPCVQNLFRFSRTKNGSAQSVSSLYPGEEPF